MEGRVPEDLAVVIDTGGRIMVWSAGAQRLLGYEPTEIVGRSAAELLAAVLPGSARRHVADGQQCTSEVALRHRNGDRVVVRLQGTPLLEAGSKRLWLVTGAAPAMRRHDSTQPSPPWRATTSWDIRTPSGMSNSQVGPGSVVTEAIRRWPSGCSTSGRYRWVDSANRPAAVVTHASNPLTSTIRPVGGVVAVRSRA